MENKDLIVMEIDKSKFELANAEKITDLKFETKPVGYYKDAWNRFKKNKASLVAACIIILIILFSLIAPLISPFSLKFSDVRYAKVRPKIPMLSFLGVDGTTKKEISSADYDYLVGIGIASLDPEGKNLSIAEGKLSESFPIVKEPKVVNVDYSKGSLIINYTNYIAKIDSYKEVGFQFLDKSYEEYVRIREYEAETGINIIFPMCVPEGSGVQNANIWYERDKNGTAVKVDGSYVPLFLTDTNNNYVYYSSTGEGEGSYGRIRVLYRNYFIYENDTEPVFMFGTNAFGEDIFIRLAVGCRTSLIFSFCVAITCFIIGAIIGAIEGYYGGWVDMVIERLLDVLAGIPFIVVVSLFRFHLVDTGKVSSFTTLLFVYILTGWMGTAALVRRQFYRFKNQEYILAARTLGAKDGRLMFKHIFPNTLGTIITSSVLVIPGVIFAESSLAFLKILKITGPDGASIGTMLSDGYSYLREFPHIVFFPALIISLLMISFNLFGNGLRDAFNPALRGVEG